MLNRMTEAGTHQLTCINMVEGSVWTVTIPWASREGMDPDAIRRANILESAGLVGLGSAFKGLSKVGKGVPKKNSLAKEAIDADAADLSKIEPESTN